MGGPLTRAGRVCAAPPAGHTARTAGSRPPALPFGLRGAHRRCVRRARPPPGLAATRGFRHADAWRRVMSSSPPVDALRKANPRNNARFSEALDASATEVRARIETAVIADRPHVRPLRPSRRLLALSAAGALAAAAVGVFLTLGSSDVTPGVEVAAAAIKKAATLTATSADRSGSASVRMTHNGRLWVHKTVRWNGDDVEISDESPRGPSSGLPLLVVNGMMYGHDPD